MIGGRRNVLPGTIVFAALGAAGQAIYNAADQKKTEEWVEETERKARGEAGKARWWDSKWSPMKVLNDGEYKAMLEDRLLRVEVELGEVDEGIKMLRELKAREELEQRNGQT